MPIKSGRDLEDVIFGRHSDGDAMMLEYWDKIPDFDSDFRYLLSINTTRFPGTYVAKEMFCYLEKSLDEKGVRTEGLVFLSTIGTKVDLRFFTDGFFYLPVLPILPLTIDAFFIGKKKIEELRDKWIDSCSKKRYSFADFQSDLFRYKAGLSKWLRDLKACKEEGLILIEPADLREYTKVRRPENHFIVTQENIRTRVSRKAFSENLAAYLERKARPRPKRRKTAQQSHK